MLTKTTTTQGLEMSALDKIKEKAKAAKRRVVLPEGTEPRSVEAAATIIADQMASVTLLGNEQEMPPSPNSINSIWTPLR